LLVTVRELRSITEITKVAPSVCRPSRTIARNLKSKALHNRCRGETFTIDVEGFAMYTWLHVSMRKGLEFRV